MKLSKVIAFFVSLANYLKRTGIDFSIHTSKQTQRVCLVRGLGLVKTEKNKIWQMKGGESDEVPKKWKESFLPLLDQKNYSRQQLSTKEYGYVDNK